MIGSLKFFKDREALAGPDGFQIHPHHKDRTVAAIRKYLDVSAVLRQARGDTMGCISARPGKGRAITFEVMDSERFAALQEAIASHEEQLAALDQAITKLDEMAGDGELWFSDLEYTVGGLGNTEGHERRRLAHMASAVLAKGMRSGKTPDEILKDDADYQTLFQITETQIKQANEQLAVLRPKLAEMKAILESVGC